MVNAVIALGGNAILPAGEDATSTNQLRHLEKTCDQIVKVMDRFETLIITHGNGPQVGDIVLQNEAAKNIVPPMPLDVCVAESQGQLGYFIQVALLNSLAKAKMKAEVLCILTTVRLANGLEAVPPSKPIGPYYAKEEAEGLTRSRGWTFKEDVDRGGYRRIVPSPRPEEVIGLEAIERLLQGDKRKGRILIVGGGGGVPLRLTGGRLEGVEAVIDKDLTSAIIACGINADMLIMLTDIDAIYKDHGKSSASPLRLTDPMELEALYREGQFPSGTMGPKVQAAIQFVRQCGRRAVITDPEDIIPALDGEKGTTVVRER